VKETGESKMWRSEREYHQKFFLFFCGKLTLQTDGRRWDETERERDVTVYSIYSDHVPPKLIQNFSQKCLFFLTPPM